MTNFLKRKSQIRKVLLISLPVLIIIVGMMSFSDKIETEFPNNIIDPLPQLVKTPQLKITILSLVNGFQSNLLMFLKDLTENLLIIRTVIV